MTIPGGYILQPRCIDDSDIMREPPVVRELWFYLLRRVNHKDAGKYRRGSGFFNLGDIQDALCWYIGYRKQKYSKPQLTKSLRRLREKGMINTSKATRGVYVTVLNYAYYQDPKNYDPRNSYESNGEGNGEGNNEGNGTEPGKSTPGEGIQGDYTNESNGEGNTKETRRKQSGRTKNKNDKNVRREEEKNIDGESSASPSTSPDPDPVSGSTPGPDPDPESELEKNFENPNVRTLVQQAIERVHLTRKCGKAQPSIVSRFIRELRQYEDWKVGTGLTRYLEGEYHLDGKGERYALGIVRNSTAKDWQEVISRLKQDPSNQSPANEQPTEPVVQPRNYKEAKDAERRSRAMRLLQTQGDEYAKQRDNQQGIGQIDDCLPLSGTG